MLSSRPVFLLKAPVGNLTQIWSPGRGNRKEHVVGGGFGGLAAGAYLIQNAAVSGQDITIYEADEQLGGGLFLGGSAESGYNLPGSVFDKQFRCTFELLNSIPSASDPSISVTEEFFAFNKRQPYHDRAHIFDRNGRMCTARVSASVWATASASRASCSRPN